MTPEITNLYLHGRCYYLATALHYHFGFRVAISRYSKPYGDHPMHFCFHAWNILPDGDHFDIQGRQTHEQITEYFDKQIEAEDKRTIIQPGLGHLFECLSTKVLPDHPWCKQAILDALEHLPDLRGYPARTDSPYHWWVHQNRNKHNVFGEVRINETLKPEKLFLI